MKKEKDLLPISDIKTFLDSDQWILQNLGYGWTLRNTKPYQDESYKVSQLQIDRLKNTGRYKVKELSRSFQLVKVRD